MIWLFSAKGRLQHQITTYAVAATLRHTNSATFR